FQLSWLIVVLALVSSDGRADDSPAAIDYFEREVRPILVDTCQKCHGAEKQESDLRLDTRAGVLQGGVSGAAVEPGNP
ncbi:hypothetical protein MRO55_26480, partial [Escherichia coli]|uniref:c-type cytochrome domain-containing protein n=1 Tax=Escherichia coli TaxID=562 RepID=UPI00211435F4